jgi:DNA-binding CsgD family transcriptional regulator
VNTVATIGKRIYSKLRVHSRAELAARIQTL